MLTETHVDSLATVLDQTGLAEAGRADLRTVFGPSFVVVRDLVAESASIVVTDATQVTAIKAARAARLKIKAARVAVENLRKSTKEEALRYGQGVDRVAKMIAGMCEPEERRLEEAEMFAERAEAARKDALQASRREALAPFVPDVTIYPLRDMTEAAWGQLLDGSRSAHEARIAAAAKAEADRLAVIERDRLEAIRIREENARLAREAAEREAAAKVERERAAAELKAEQDKARAERERLEADAKREREAREAVERKAAQERAAAEAKVRAEREAADAAKRAAEAAPDAEKLRAFAVAIMAVDAPSMETEQADRLLDKIIEARTELVARINAAADKLGK